MSDFDEYDLRCRECGMRYAMEYPADQRAHRIHHDAVMNGVPRPPVKTEKVIWRWEHHRIILVTPLSPKTERVRARKVARLANREMHYDFGIYYEGEGLDSRDRHLFLYGVDNRLVGLAILERRDHICRVTWEEYDRGNDEDLEPAPPVWSLGFVWVHLSCRRQGIARRLFEEGFSYLGLSREMVGVRTPFSEEGEKFARALFPTGFLLAK